MTHLKVLHRTTYRYSRPVLLGSHRLMLRSRESLTLRPISSEVNIWPAAEVRWAHDVFGNSVGTAAFQGMTDSLVIASRQEWQLFGSAWPIFDIAASAIDYPFRYSQDEWTDLGALPTPRYADVDGRLKRWAQAFVGGDRTDTLALLKDLCAGVASAINYQSRDDEGTQTPLQTLDRGWGSCRDLAVLFVEAARCLGFGARIVSGYLFNPEANQLGSADMGSTHAWADVFVSGAGWISFDPTNRSVGGPHLIPVAVARDIAQAMPVSGSFIGDSDAFLGMTVSVEVTSLAAPEQAPV